MANDVYDISSDIEVSIYAYPSDVMVWSVSRWDQDNWSDGTEVEAWQPITGSIIQVDTDNGLTVDRGFLRSETPTASIVLQNQEYDPFNNGKIRTGTPIRVRARITPDTSPIWITLFTGKIDNASASYSHEWLNTVTLTCVTDIRDVLNFTVPSGLTTIDPAYATNYIDAINTAGGFSISASAIPAYLGYLLTGATPTGPVIVGELINSLTDTNLGALIYKPGEISPIRYVTKTEIGDLNSLTPYVYFEAETSANPDRADFSDLTVGFDTDEVLNTVTYSTLEGYGPITLTNVQSRELMGELSQEVTTMHFNNADADTWANDFAQVLPERSVRDITAPVIKRSGPLNTAIVAANVLDVANVSVNNSSVTIDEKYFIIRIAYSITRYTFDALFTLWKGR